MGHVVPADFVLFTIRRDMNLEVLRVEGYRKFCNKIFKATKFAMLITPASNYGVSIYTLIILSSVEVNLSSLADAKAS
jgi:valyl-tRNA synthetase